LHFFEFLGPPFSKMDILKMSKIHLPNFKISIFLHYFLFKYKMWLYHIIYFIHILLICFICLGFLLPKKYLIYYLICWPLMYLDWNMNDHRCILTQIENKLRGRKYTPDVYTLFSLVLKKFGINISQQTTCKIIVYGSTVCWVIAFLRYVL
jgi:hypothetical protein